MCLAALALLAAGCGGTALYGPPEPGRPSASASASVSLQLFRRAETGPFAQAFRAGAARFTRDSRNRRIAASVLGEEAYRVSADVGAWARVLRRAPVPREYEQAKAELLRGVTLLRQGYRQIGDGLLFGEPGQLSQGRTAVRAGSRLLGGAAAAEPV